MSLEMISLIASSLGGFIFKMIADKAEQQKMLLERHTAVENSMAEARKLDTPSSNKIRKFLVISFMMMSMIVLLAPLLGFPTVVEIHNEGISFLGFSIGGTTVFETIDGIVAPEWLGQAVMSVVGFYFGQSVGSRKHL